MSKYTTQVRYICEQLCELDESLGYEDIDRIVREAAPKLFNFNFPIFDENYRLPLEVKILKYYYMREISEETIGLWKLRLENKLNEIMPYYNQLYLSELLQFNPLHDVDVTTVHKRDFDGRTTGQSNRVNEQQTGRQLNREIDDVFAGVKNTNNRTDENENIGVNGETHNNEDNTFVGNEVNTGNKNATTDREEKTVYGKEIDRTENIKTTEDKQGTANGDRVYTNTENEQGDETNFNKGWNLFSDTPQGSVDIFGVAVVGANGEETPNAQYIDGRWVNPDSVAGESYLTTATRTLNNGGREYERTTNGSGNEETSGRTTEDNIIETDKVGNETEDGNKTVNESIEYNETTGSEKQTNNTGNVVNDGTHSQDTDRVMQNSFEGEVRDSTRRDIDTNENEDTNRNEEENIDTVGTINNTEDFVEHIAGKRGSYSYSYMLNEFRSTFLNIDKMILDELSVCFFSLW